MALLSKPDPLEILQVAGLLYWGTTGFASEAQYGTKLGFLAKGLNFYPNPTYRELTEVETGQSVTDIIFTGDRPVVIANLRNYNATALARLFPGMAVGSAVKSPGSYGAGTSIKGTGGYLLFVPEDTTNHPCLLLQKAVPHLYETAVLLMSHSDKTIFTCKFSGLLKSSDADGKFYLGPIAGAVLR